MSHFARRTGYEVRVVAPVPYFPPLKINRRWLYSQISATETIEGLEVHHPRYFMIPKVSMFLQGLLMFLNVLPHVRRVRKSFDFDLIDAHYVYPDGFAAVLIGLCLRKPVVVSARGTDINVYSEFRLIRRFLAFTLKKAHGVVAVSKALAKGIEQLGIPPARVTVIPNGVDHKRFFPAPQAEARARLKLPPGRLILSVGHLIAGKGFDLLVRAFHSLIAQKDFGDIRLVIVGEGYFRSQLESLIMTLKLEGKVVLIGDRPHDELPDWYNASDVFCLVSAREGWPNVIVEAMGCGKPVVATPVGGIPEILCSKSLGILVEPDIDAIANALSVALTAHWKTDQISNHSRLHDWERATQSLQALFWRVLKGRASSKQIDPHSGASNRQTA
ncbi:MAG: glycosyltransferase family 4 protein [Acidobacteriota bacterium]